MTDSPQMIEYSNQEIGVSLSVPEEWSGEMVSSNQFRLFGLPETGFEKYFDEYRCTMSYTLAEPEDSNISNWFETLIHESQKEIEQEYNDYQLVSEQYCQIADRPGYVRHYEWTEESLGLRLSQLQSLIQADDSSFYLINAAALKPLEAKYMPIFISILQSTKIIAAEALPSGS